MAERNPNPTARDGDKQGKGEGDKQGKGKGKIEGEAEGLWVFKPTRHMHELFLFKDLPVYECSGCKELGADTGYRCKTSTGSKCEKFCLHKPCAELPDDIPQPFCSNGMLKFRPKTKLVHHCSVCQEKLKGYVFETANCDIRLHPLCMMLPKLLNYSGHADHELKIMPGDLKGKEYTCSNCRHVITSGGWRYGCEECKFYVDPRCAKEDIFGLPEHAIHSKSGGKRKTAAVFFKSIITGAAATLINALITGAVSELFQNQSSEEQKATDRPSQEG